MLRNEIPPTCLVTAYAVEEASKLIEQNFEEMRLARISLVKRFFAQRSVPLAKEQEARLETTILIFQRFGGFGSGIPVLY